MHTIIADDDPITRRILAKLLARFGTVDEAPDGSSVLSAVETALSWASPPDLICLDVRMPGLPGLEALREIRRLEDAMSLPGAARARILMITSVREGATVIEAFRQQADGYLTKPVDIQRLEEKIQRLGLI